MHLAVSEGVHGRTVDAEHGADVPCADTVDFLELGREGRKKGREKNVRSGFKNSFVAVVTDMRKK